MFLKGDVRRYGVLAATLHWVAAIAILLMLPLGFLAARASDPARTAALLRLHAPLGLFVLVLTIGRTIWWLIDLRPDAPPGQPRWQACIAHASHVGLYLVIILLCGSGIALVLSSSAGPSIFSGDGKMLPSFAAYPALRGHRMGAMLLVGLLGLHLSATIYHQLVRRDRLLARMRVGKPVEQAR